MNSSKPRILVSVISYNEQDSISKTLNDLKNHNFGFDVVVVDNGSSDATLTECRRLNVEIISHCSNTGSSVGTLNTYFLYAYRNQYDILLQFDGDGQHQAKEIPNLIKPILEKRANCTIGSRFIKNTGFQSYFLRRLGIRLFSWICSSISGFKFTDITSGFRAYDPKIIKLFGHDFPHGLHDSVNQFVLISYFSGCKFEEVAVEMLPREAGSSEVNIWNAVVFPLKWSIGVITCWMQRGYFKRLASRG